VRLVRGTPSPSMGGLSFHPYVKLGMTDDERAERHVPRAVGKYVLGQEVARPNAVMDPQSVETPLA